MQARRPDSKLKKFRIRAVSTVVLVGSFVGCVYAGHVPLMVMIFGIQAFPLEHALHSEAPLRPCCAYKQHMPHV